MKLSPFLATALLSLFALLTQPGAAQTPYGHNPAAGHYLETRGFKLYYETYGQGAPLLLLHGNGGSISNMANQIPYFAQNYKVIAIDTNPTNNAYASVNTRRGYQRASPIAARASA